MIFKRILFLLVLASFVLEIYEPSGRFVRAYKLKPVSSASVSCGDFLSMENCKKATDEAPPVFDNNYTNHKSVLVSTFRVIPKNEIKKLIDLYIFNYKSPTLFKFHRPPIFIA